MAEKMERINFSVDIPKTEFILDYRFNNNALLKEAFESYHRLEFLGDAVLEFVMAIYVYNAFPTLDKGKFVRLVKTNVRNDVLGKIAIEHEFHNFLLDKDTKNRANEYLEAITDKSKSDCNLKPPKVLANVIEAIAGAVYVDTEFSFDRVWKVFQPWMSALLTPENKCNEHSTDVSSSIKTPSSSETGVMKETQSSKEKQVSAQCKCDEVKMFIANLIPKFANPSYKSNVLDEIEQKLNYNFKSRKFLKDTFCQRLEILTLNVFKRCKICDEAFESEGLKSYEKMEFLGNLFLKVAITIYLYNKYPHDQPGILTTLRSNIMDNAKLARVAVVKLEVHKHLTFANKLLEDKVKKFIKDIEDNCNDVNPPSVLVNIVESIAGSMFIDSSAGLMENISSCVNEVWEKLKILLEPLATPETLERNPISELQELCHKKRRRVEYRDHKVTGEEKIAVEVLIDDVVAGRAENIKKEVAKKSAARKVLKHFKSGMEPKLSE